MENRKRIFYYKITISVKKKQRVIKLEKLY